MDRPRHRKPRHDMDEPVSLHGHNPDNVLRRLMGVDGMPRPVESHEEAEDPDKQEEGTEPS
jgi:hypothetical protein